MYIYKFLFCCEQVYLVVNLIPFEHTIGGATTSSEVGHTQVAVWGDLSEFIWQRDTTRLVGLQVDTPLGTNCCTRDNQSTTERHYVLQNCEKEYLTKYIQIA